MPNPEIRAPDVRWDKVLARRRLRTLRADVVVSTSNAAIDVSIAVVRNVIISLSLWRSRLTAYVLIAMTSVEHNMRARGGIVDYY